MNILSRRAGLCVFFVAVLSGPRLAAGVAGAATHELRDGSSIRDDCNNCDRLPIERPLQGSFILRALPSAGFAGSAYEVRELAFDSPDGEYSVRGGGLYMVSADASGEGSVQELTLDLAVNGAAVHLESGRVSVRTAFPALDITVTQEPQGGLLQFFTIRVLAAPPMTLVRYQLVDGDPATFAGSFFVDDCLICGRPTIFIPVQGNFFLGEIDGAPNPVSTYRVDSLEVESLPGLPEYRVTGAGSYRQGGEVALLQSMDLRVSVNSEAGVDLAGGPVPFPEGVRFPEISIELGHQDPASPLHVYSLRLVARPFPLVIYIRGDSNADTAVDLSDVIFTLNWRFRGGAGPTCLEAADANDDGAEDISDAVFTLSFLFRGGPAPPEPGPTCGPAPEREPRCEIPTCIGI
jgi:hypothetical protein